LATITAVFVQVGGVSVTSHKRSDDVLKVAVPAAESFARGETDWLSPFGAADSSGRAVGGASVVNETVLLALVPRESATEYVSVDVPIKPAAPVNVTTPVEVFTEYDPSPVTERDVAVQFGAVSPERHRRTVDAVIVAPDAPVSFVAGFIVIAIAVPPDAVSARAVGGTAHCTTIMPWPPAAAVTVVALPIPPLPIAATY
jgi:hypothetical protein